MKKKRQQKLLEIINENVVLTQDDIQNLLLEAGFEVTQSTVSRDIKELRLIKGHDAAGNYRYISNQINSSEKQSHNRYREIFSHYVLSVDFAMNDVVIKCEGGMASSVCVALDTIFKDMMLGTLAGEDTIFVVTHSSQEAETLATELKKMI